MISIHEMVLKPKINDNFIDTSYFNKGKTKLLFDIECKKYFQINWTNIQIGEKFSPLGPFDDELKLMFFTTFSV